jgi:hypothetical protein
MNFETREKYIKQHFDKAIRKGFDGFVFYTLGHQLVESVLEELHALYPDLPVPSTMDYTNIDYITLTAGAIEVFLLDDDRVAAASFVRKPFEFLLEPPEPPVYLEVGHYYERLDGAIVLCIEVTNGWARCTTSKATQSPPIDGIGRAYKYTLDGLYDGRQNDRQYPRHLGREVDPSTTVPLTVAGMALEVTIEDWYAVAAQVAYAPGYNPEPESTDSLFR